MPNIKSAEKRVKVTQVKTLKNQAVKSTLRTYSKKFYAAVAMGDKAACEAAYAMACSKIDKAVGKGVLHINTASRKKKTMAAALSAMN